MFENAKNVFKNEYLEAVIKGNVESRRGLQSNPDKVIAHEDDMGGIGIYISDCDGKVYSPYYEQFNTDELDCRDENGEFDEQSCLISLANATEWRDWKWTDETHVKKKLGL